MHINSSKLTKRMFYCYALCDPRKPGKFNYGPRMTFSHEPFYIGYGHGDRSEQHVKVAKRNSHNSPKENKIRKILNLGYDVVVVRTKTKSTLKRAQAREVELIKAIGRADLKTGPLTNLNAGGKGGGGDISEMTRAKMRAAKLGKPRSEESRRKQSSTSKGRKRSSESVAKSAAALRGRKVSDETKRKISEAKKGVPQPAEAARRSARSRTGKTRVLSEQARANIAKANVQRGKPWSAARRRAHELSKR